MSKLPLPLERALRDTTPDAGEVDRLWAATEERLLPRPKKKLMWAASLATAMILLIVVGLRLRAPSPLGLADGRPLAAALHETTRTLVFADGSRLEMEEGAALDPLSNDASELALLLRHGNVRVQASSSRRWTLDAGLASIVARGARFAVYRQESAVEVRVFEGTLTVRGENVPGSQRQLAAGESLRVAAPPIVPAVTAPVVVPSPAAAPSWRKLARASRFDAAFDTLGSTGVRAATRSAISIDELLLLADVARLSGHSAEALPVLERAMREFAGDPRAGLAAYTAGRVQADELHEPRRGAAAFAEAVKLGLPETLEETAYLRLVETRAEIGDRAGAMDAALRYDERFPSGRFHTRIQSLVGKP